MTYSTTLPELSVILLLGASLTSCKPSTAPVGGGPPVRFEVPYQVDTSFEKLDVRDGVPIAGVKVAHGQAEMLYDGRTLRVPLPKLDAGTLVVHVPQAPIGIPYELTLADAVNIRWTNSGITIGEHTAQIPARGTFRWSGQDVSPNDSPKWVRISR